MQVRHFGVLSTRKTQHVSDESLNSYSNVTILLFPIDTPEIYASKVETTSGPESISPLFFLSIAALFPLQVCDRTVVKASTAAISMKTIHHANSELRDDEYLTSN